MVVFHFLIFFCKETLKFSTSIEVLKPVVLTVYNAHVIPPDPFGPRHAIQYLNATPREAIRGTTRNSGAAAWLCTWVYVRITEENVRKRMKSNSEVAVKMHNCRIENVHREIFDIIPPSEFYFKCQQVARNFQNFVQCEIKKNECYPGQFM